MSRLLTIPLAAALFLPAYADWMPGEPHNMHYPQLPDPNGIDIKASLPKVLADDWLSRSTGPLTEVHIWGSWFNDQKYTASWIHLSVHSNLPADPQFPFSRPGPLLWEDDFAPGEYTQRIYGDPSPQTFWDPKQPYDPAPNHFNTWQYNIENIDTPFQKVAGEVYWLDVTFFDGFNADGSRRPIPSNFMFGWKTSISPQFMDDAVWRHLDDPNPQWLPLFDPRIPPGQPKVSLDLAFVVVPEPTTLIAIALGGMLLLTRTRRI